MLNLFRYIGFRHLQLKPGRVLLTTLGVAFGIALYVAIAIINDSTRNTFRESIESISGKAKLSISAGVSGFDESKLESIRTTPGVKAAVPMVEARAFFIGATESNQGLYIMGVDLLQETAVRSYKATDQRIIDDPLTFLNQPDSIIITLDLAKKKNLKLDSKIQLTTLLGLKTFTVRGLLEPEGAARAYGGSLALMDIDGARVMFGKENKLDRVDIVAQKGVTTEELKKNLRTTLGPGIAIESPEGQTEQMEGMLSSYQLILTFFSTLALLVGLFLVMNSISIAVAERRREIGTLRALGATRGSMVYLFVTEIFGISLAGSLLGCLLGRVLAGKLVGQVTASYAAQFQTRVEVTHLVFSSTQIVTAVGLGVFASLFAAFIPALKAAKIHPLESMKSHAESVSAGDERRSNYVMLTGLGLLIFLTVSNVYQWGKIWSGIELATKISSVLGAALFGPFLVFLLIRLFRSLSKNSRSAVVKISQDNLLRSRKRTTSNVMALMVGLFLVMLIATVRSSFHHTLITWLDRVFIADFMVASQGRLIEGDVMPIKEEIAKDILAVPGVRPIGEDRGIGSRLVPYYFNGAKMIIKAHDHFADFYQYKNFAIIDSDRITTASALYSSPVPALIVTENFLMKQHYHVGDWVKLPTPTGEVPFKIIGKVVDFASAEGVLYMNRAWYKKFFQDTKVTAFLIDAAPGYSREQVREGIDEKVGKKWDVVTISNREFHDQMEQTVERSFAYTRAIELIALLVGLLGLLNTLLISVMERTREIGMLRAVGTTRQQIVQIIMSEAVIQGFFGAIVAIALGAYVGKLFIEYNLSSTLGWLVDFYFPRESILNTLVIGVFVAAVAGILPAVRAAKLNITEALEYE